MLHMWWYSSSTWYTLTRNTCNSYFIWLINFFLFHNYLMIKLMIYWYYFKHPTHYTLYLWINPSLLLFLPPLSFSPPPLFSSLSLSFLLTHKHRIFTRFIAGVVLVHGGCLFTLPHKCKMGGQSPINKFWKGYWMFRFRNRFHWLITSS